LGMDICRACASFFKRAKMTGRVYPCRQGNHQCLINKDTKSVCRRCRFDKCITVGVIYDGPLRVRAKPEISFMQKMEKEFKSLIERRRDGELAFMETCQHIRLVQHPREKIYIVDHNLSADLHMIAISESWVFYENVFPALQNLPRQENEIIFKDYVKKLGMIISYYLTKKLWGDVSKKMMNTVITCFDTEIPFDVYFPEDRGDKNLFESSVRSYNDEFAALFLPQFNRTQLTEQEFHALTALVITEHGTNLFERLSVEYEC
ncbi:hypothetical protein PENTCL1PPCAC_17159, partial [Pristionchus entomophagus]